MEVPDATFVAGKRTLGLCKWYRSSCRGCNTSANFNSEGILYYGHGYQHLTALSYYSHEQPKDAWDTLKNHFERDTLANKLLLKKKYFRTEMKDGTSMEVYLKHMKELTDKPAAIGAPISEEEQVVTLLRSLPQSYSTLVTALEAQVDDISLGYVQQALLHEEQKLSSWGDRATRKQESKALLSRQREKKQPRRVKCYGCQGFGHYKRDCPKRSQLQKESKSGHSAKPVSEEGPVTMAEDTGEFVATC